jgi:outer membrane protein
MTRTIYPDIPDNYRTRLDLQWPVYTAGRVTAMERAAEADLDAARNDIEALAGDVRLDIVGSYLSLLTAEEALVVAEQSVRRIEAHLSDVRNRHGAGLVPPNEVLSAEALRSRQEVLLIEARNARDM